MKKNLRPRFWILAVALSPAVALAHPGHAPGDSLLAGLLHPLAGIDHLFALLAVGLLAGRMGSASRFAIPVLFLALMGLGTASGVAGFELPHAELVIVASCVTLALLALFPPQRLPIATTTLAAAFALFHGHAHGAEATHDVSAVQYCSGLLVASTAVIALGYLGARALRRARGAELLQLDHRH